MKNSLNLTGYSLVEVLLAMAVFSTVLFASLSVFAVTQEASRIGTNKIKAGFYMRDYIEKIKNIRRSDWDVLVNGLYVIDYNYVLNEVYLSPTTDGEIIQGYTRFLEIGDAYRDSSGDLLDAPGLIDPSSKKVTITVSWEGIHSGTITESMYLTRYMDNLSWVQTTETEMNAGTHSGTTVVNNAGGEIILGAGGQSDWCDPSLTIQSLDLPKSGVANAITAIEGRAFAGTGNNASGASLINIEISNDNPPVLSILGSIDGYKTNDVFGDNLYGYIATDTNSSEVEIIDISSTPYSKSGYFNIPGNTDGNSIFIAGTVGFVTENSKLWSFDLSSKSGLRPILDPDGLNLGGSGNAVYVVGDYAYIATGGTEQLKVIDISNPSNLTLVSELALSGGDGSDLYVNESGTRAFIVTHSSAQPEFYIVDITNKTGPLSVIGTYDSGSMDPRGIEIVAGGKAIIVGVGGEEYQVINISVENNLSRCGGLEIDTGIFDSASILESDNDAYTYIVTGDASEELKIIEGGPGGSVATSGVFESQTLDTGFNSTGFNRFTVTEDEPTGTSIRYQVAAIEPDPGGCDVTTFDIFDFVGPTGDSTSYFSEGDKIPTNNDGINYENPSQCFRFRAYLETVEYTQTPTFYDFTLNYSP